jgi:hypothetical protein
LLASALVHAGNVLVACAMCLPFLHEPVGDLPSMQPSCVFGGTSLPFHARTALTHPHPCLCS